MMRLKNGKWFAAFKLKGRMVGTSLDAYEHERAKAAMNLGRLLEKMERGEEPSQLRKKFRTMVPRYWEQFEKRIESKKTETIRIRNEIAIRLHLIPFFGEIKFEDTAEDTIRDFVKVRERKGATKSTLKKELRVLKDILVLANPGFEMPEIEFSHKGKTQSRALMMDEVLNVQKFVKAQSQEFGTTYKIIYQILAFTSMDVKEVVNLNWDQIDMETGWIRGNRFKTGNPVRIPICRRLNDLLKSFKVRNIDGRLFHGMSSKQVATALRRAFKAAGLGEFSAKSLRHFAPSLLGNAGCDEAIIAKGLGHSAGSKCTKVYIHPYDSTLKQAFKLLDEGYGDFENKEAVTT